MSTPLQPPPSQEVLIGFLQKLADFHKTLSPVEQTILDDMTAKAIAPPQDEAQGFALGDGSVRQFSALGQAFGSSTMAAYYYYYRPKYNYQ